MDCPKCQNGEIGASGMCAACGYKAAASASASGSDGGENQNSAGITAIDYAEESQTSAPGNEQPQWRQDLSKRLQAIKQKREAMGLSKKSGRAENDLSFQAPRTTVEQSPIITPARFIEGPPLRKPAQKPRSPIPRQKTLQPIEHETSAEKLSAKSKDPREIQNLIDDAVSRKSSQPSEFSAFGGIYNSTESQPQEYEGKLILLSRTLCGLVDLIIVMVCTGMLILAADFFSGIISLDAISYLCFSVLFLMTYFFYSLFFLAATNQTIGMMITDLRVVGAYDERPSFRQLMRRCWAYLLSLFGLGFGLFWGLFDRESLCFHDRISDTRVERL
jgi:uncharacterized RDD family membrane protein YckC